MKDAIEKHYVRGGSRLYSELKTQFILVTAAAALTFNLNSHNSAEEDF